jgi:hypothetical protein
LSRSISDPHVRDPDRSLSEIDTETGAGPRPTLAGSVSAGMLERRSPGIGMDPITGARGAPAPSKSVAPCQEHGLFSPGRGDELDGAPPAFGLIAIGAVGDRFNAAPSRLDGDRGLFISGDSRPMGVKS